MRWSRLAYAGGGVLLLWFVLVIALPAWLKLPCSHPGLCLNLSASESSLRQAVLLSLGGLLASVTLWITYRRHELARDEDWTKRYNEAISHIGSDSEASRIGGFFALERMGIDSKRDHWRTIQVLAAYVRHPHKDDLEYRDISGKRVMAPSVAAAMAALATLCRERGPEGTVDLSNSTIPESKLDGANLRGAIFEGANMQRATLSGADLGKANFSGAELQGATLHKIDARGSSFHGAYLQGAQFQKSDLRRAHFGISDLRSASFQNTRLEGAVFYRQRVKQGAARNTTQRQLAAAASWDEETIWPPGSSPTEQTKAWSASTAKQN